jgi:uncharacterized protein (TIGR03083 family)
MTTAEGTATTPDPGSAYRTVRTRISALLDGADPEVAGRRVPGCPDWTVRELVSHLVGACSDILAGRADGAGSDAWTAAQVAARHGQQLPEMLAEWATTGDQVAAALAGRSALGQVLMDALSHEYDLREALGEAPPSQDPLLDPALGWLILRFGRWLEHTGGPAVRLVTDGVEHVLGPGEPTLTLRTSRYLALRMFTGRLPLESVQLLDWEGDPSALLGALTWGPFRPAS